MSDPLPPMPESAEPSSLASRLVNVVVAPGELFDEVKAAPINLVNWFVPAVIFVVASWIAAALIFTQPNVQHQLRELQEQAMQKQVQSGRLSQAQADQALQATGKFAMIGALIGAVAGPVVMALVAPLFWGLLFWLVGNKAFGGDIPYFKAVEVVGLSGVIAAVDALVKGLLIVALGSLWVTPGPILLIKHYDPQNLGHLWIGLISLTVLWLLAVRALGLARVSGVSFGKAALVVFPLWFLVMGGMASAGVLVGRAFGGG